MNLEELQRAMGAAIMQPLTVDEQMRDFDVHGRAMEQLAGEFIRPNERLTAFERLEIYNRQYWFRLQGAFGEDFRALRSVVGEKRFEALTNAYLLAHPSRSFTLRNLGARLYDWLVANEAHAGSRLALALDVIRVEWACVEAFDNADREPLTVLETAEVNGDSRLGLQPHVQLLELAYPADDLVLEMHRREKKESTEAGTTSEMVHRDIGGRLRLRKRPTWLAVHRADLSVYYRRLSRDEYRMLCALRDGMTLSEALEAAFTESRLAVTTRVRNVGLWFEQWSQLGWICKRFPEDSRKEK